MITDALRIFKSKLHTSLNSQDRRAIIQDSDFVVGLIQAVAKAKGNFSLSSLHQSVCLFLDAKIGRSSFNERLGTLSLVKHLQLALATLLMMRPPTDVKSFSALYKKIGVSGIIGIDASLVSLWDSLCEHFKGTFMVSALKLHFAIDLVTGSIQGFNITDGATHDSKWFAKIWRGKLYIFDLGYWSIHLLKEISDKGAFFLTRVKSNASLNVTEMVYGIGKSIVGSDLLSYPIHRRRKKIVELLATLNTAEKDVEVRVIGFWYKKESTYRWYVTNLKCSRELIYDLYRLRWQIELTFKSMKSILNFHRMPTTNPNTVTSLTLVTLINYIFSVIIRTEARIQASKKGLKNKGTTSILRASNFYSQSADIILRLACLGRRITSSVLSTLYKNIIPHLSNVFDPNYKKRKTSLGRLQTAVMI